MHTESKVGPAMALDSRAPNISLLSNRDDPSDVNVGGLYARVSKKARVGYGNADLYSTGERDEQSGVRLQVAVDVRRQQSSVEERDMSHCLQVVLAPSATSSGATPTLQGYASQNHRELETTKLSSGQSPVAPGSVPPSCQPPPAPVDRPDEECMQ